MQIRSPKEIANAADAAGKVKANLTSNNAFSAKFIGMSFAAGAFIALGGLLSVVAGYGFPEASAGNPSLQKMLSGLVFPIGLVLVVVLGAELFTGNNALLIPGMMRRDIRPSAVLKNWTLVWIGNFAGALAMAYFLTYLAGITASDPYHSAIIRMAETKATLPWWGIFVRGIGANWCVCLAVWLAMAGNTLTEKVAGCWIPVAAFVILGYEHCVANMFFIPAGMLEGADVTIYTMTVGNLIPATLGNITGGALFVGTLHGYLRLKG